ncbi:MAG: phosphoserine phosphatase SerB [Cryobacterium sp.]|nr:phosphoserine phosphatase SerB [Cryobacterium sp.]
MTRFLVLLDVDSTLIEDEVIELLAEAAGSLDRVAEITSAAMNGEVDFEASLLARVKTLAGLPERELEHAGRRIRVTEGAEELISAVHAAGGRIGVVSGGFHQVIDPLAAALGLDRWRANNLEISEGTLTGRVVGRVIDARAKAETLREWAAIYGLELRQTVAIGDGANDLPMMKATGLSVGFDAKAPVRDEADVIMDVRDLSQVLPLLGLRG